MSKTKERPIEPACFETDMEEQWYDVGYYDGFTDAIEKACKAYCDHLCGLSQSCGCYHKYDHLNQVKSTFKYNECNPLQVIRRVMEEE